MASVADLLYGKGIRLRSYGPGNHKTTCPACSHTRKNKTEPCLSVTIGPATKADGARLESGEAIWRCHHCPETGNVDERADEKREARREEWKRDRQRERGNRGERAAMREPMARPKPPPLPKAKACRMPPLVALPKNAVELFAARGISKASLDYAGVCFTAEAWIPQREAKVPAVVFPYIRDGVIVNAKFRTRDKNFAQAKGGEKTLWLLDKADPELDDRLVIVEGEPDALACIEAAVPNPVSVPDGAPERLREDEEGNPLVPDPAADLKFAFVWNCWAALERFGRFVLAVDGDGPGRVLAEELARRLGKERCYLVTWPEGCKDANDVLVKHGADALAECIADAKPYPIAGLYGVADYADHVRSLYVTGHKRGHTIGIPCVDDLVSFRPGELTVLTGLPNHGKSQFLDNVLVRLAQRYGWRWAVSSWENPPPEHITKWAEILVGKPFGDGKRARMTQAELDDALAWLGARFHFLRFDDEAPTPDLLLERAHAAVVRHGVIGLVFDPYNEIEHRRPAGWSETEYVSWLLARLKRFAVNHGVHVFLVAHPAKLYRSKDGKYPTPTLQDIAGSANFANKADIGLVFERVFGDQGESTPYAKLHVQKIRFKSVGQRGVASLVYDLPTGRYSENAEVQGGWEDD